MNKYVLYTGLACIVLISCFNKQDHAITRPEAPRYVLSGTTIDPVTAEAVPNATVYIEGGTMLYDISFPSQTVLSDSAGRYVIDPVYPGTYTIQIIKDNIRLKGEKVQIEHRDRQLILTVPDILYANLFPRYHDLSSNSTFILFNSKHPCFGLNNLTSIFPAEYWIEEVGFQGYYFCKIKYTGNIWIPDKHLKLNYNPDFMWQIEIAQTNYYATIYPDTLMIFNKWTFEHQNTIATGITIKDISYNNYDKTLYACTDSMLYSIDLNSNTATEIARLPKTNITSMTWYGNKLYLYHKLEDLLYQINLHLQIEKVYALVNQSNNTLLLDIYDLHFDSMDKLWVTYTN